MKISITGASDDLVEVEGDIREEFSWSPDGDGETLMAVSDGTVLRVEYDKNGIWRFTRIATGTATYSKVEGDVEKDTFDVVTLEGDIKWVVIGSGIARASFR